MDLNLGLVCKTEHLRIYSPVDSVPRDQLARCVVEKSPEIIAREKRGVEQHLHFGNIRLQPESPPLQLKISRDDDGIYL